MGGEANDNMSPYLRTRVFRSNKLLAHFFDLNWQNQSQKSEQPAAVPAST
jgi:hypothetical protein